MERNKKLPLEDISQNHTELKATNTLLRVVEGFSFRYRWATENLSVAVIKFSPHSTLLPLS